MDSIQKMRIMKEKHITKLRRERLEKIFSLKRQVVRNTNIDELFFNLLQNYDQDIYGAIQQLNEYKKHPEIDQLWFFLLYECFIFLDQTNEGHQIIDLILYSVKQYYQGIINFVEYQILDIILKYEGIQILEIIEVVLASQALKTSDFEVNKLVNYISSYIPKYNNNLYKILKLLSNNLSCKKYLISNDIIMNMLLSDDYENIHQRSKIMNSLSRGNLQLQDYFYNTQYQLICLFNLNLKQCLKIIFRLLCYDETNIMRTIIKSQNIHIKIEDLQNQDYVQNKEIIEDILQELQ